MPICENCHRETWDFTRRGLCPVCFAEYQALSRLEDDFMEMLSDASSVIKQLGEAATSSGYASHEFVAKVLLKPKGKLQPAQDPNPDMTESTILPPIHISVVADVSPDFGEIITNSLESDDNE